MELWHKRMALLLLIHELIQMECQMEQKNIKSQNAKGLSGTVKKNRRHNSYCFFAVGKL